MMENDDKLLAAFFHEQRHEIPDNGFSRRLMHRLPDRSRHLSRLWSASCFALALALFIALDGLPLLLDALRQTLHALLAHGAMDLDLKSLAIAAAVLLALGYRKISSLA